MKKLLLFITFVLLSIVGIGQYAYLTDSQSGMPYIVPPNVYVYDLDQEQWFLATSELAQGTTIAQAVSGLLGHYVETGGVPEAPSDGNLYGRKNAGWQVVPTTAPSAGGGNYVNFSGTPGSTAADNADSLTLAFTRGDEVFVQGGTYSITNGSIPTGKSLLFSTGAVFNVTSPTIIAGELKAGRSQIYTPASVNNLTVSNGIIEYAYPEWFGDDADDFKRIQYCLVLFNRVDLYQGKTYYGSTGIYPPINSHIYGNYATLRINDDFPDTTSYIFWNKPLCSIYDLNITVPNYLLRGGDRADAYTGWVLKNDIDYNNSLGRDYRRPFILRNVAIREAGGYIPPENWTPDIRYHGFFVGAGKAAELGYSSESYFGDVYNLKIEYGYDTALYCSGDASVPDTQNSHMNSWYFTNCKFDYGVAHVVIDSTSRGHCFTGLMLQTYYSNPSYPYQDKPAIDIHSFGNRIDVRFEDEANHDSLIVFRNGSQKNIIISENYQVQTYVKDENTNNIFKYSNQVGNSPFFITDGNGKIIPFKEMGAWEFKDEVTFTAQTNYAATQVVDVYNTPPATYRRTIPSTQQVHQMNTFKAEGSNDALFGTTSNFGGYLLFNIGGPTTDVNIATMQWRKSDNNNAGDAKGQLLFNVFGSNVMNLDWSGRVRFSKDIKLTPTGTDPGMEEGLIFINSSTGKLNYYVGGVQYEVDATVKP